MGDRGVRRLLQGAVGSLLVGLCLTAASAADAPAQINVTIKEHRFDPAEIHVPTGKPTILVVSNQDAVAEEFDSAALKVEKVIPAGGHATIRLRPLGPGRYPFMGEFHPDTASGTVIAE